jgi:DNA polymerase-3 subunit alpha
VLDEVHNLRPKKQKKEGIDLRLVYNEIHKMCMLTRNRKIIAMTGTPMRDRPEEISSILNLILPIDSQFEGEEEFKWWFDIFGEDYYIELQRHAIPEQDKVNEVLLKFAAKYNVKVIASNDSHYVDQKDFNAHDILLCINTGEKVNTDAARELSVDDANFRNKRFAFPNDQFFFKTTEEMTTAFHDLQEAIDNTNEIVDKVEVLDLKKDILLPHFPVPKTFKTQDDYL